MKLLEGLNEAQREAVLHFSSPLLILAGAGSGKTRVITHKIAYMVNELGYRPERILAITFTNKAAREMKERVEALLGKEAPVQVSTFHSFCVKLLRSYGKKIGIERDFLILDEDDKRRLFQEILKELNLDSEHYPIRHLVSLISSFKNELFSHGELSDSGGNYEKIFSLYTKKLKDMNALDFDDLLLKGRELLKVEELRSYLSSYYQYLLIDEYQDTNRVQYEIAKALTKDKGNICAVGDEDQCIYTWRGANIDNILSFEKDFKDARIIKLEKNYRCSATILNAANAVIANNRQRKGKTLYTDNPEGEPIRLYRAQDDRDEANFIAKTVKLLIKRGRSPSDIAIFYRTNSISRVIEESLRREGIPYQVVGGVKFYERKEVKDILSYLRVLITKRDELSLLRILNTPRRGLGEKSKERLKKLLAETGDNLTALELLKKELSQERQRIALLSLIESLKMVKEKMTELGPYELIKFLLLTINYENYLKEEFGEEWEQRLENVKELGNTIAEFAEREGLKGEELYREFLASVALSSEQDSVQDEEKVLLMTVHASKGLEFPVVFLAALEEGIFPHSRSISTNDKIEEERRLFYVALTRAKELLTLSLARKRRLFGEPRRTTESRFIKELPKELIKEVKKKTLAPAPASPKSEAFSPPSDDWQKPKIVFHKKFGKGVVRRVEGRGENAKITAFFAGFGEKTVIMKFLQKLA